MEFSNSSIKNLFMFSQKKAVLIFPESETEKRFLIFSQEKVYISGNEKPLKIFLIFQETERSNLSRNVYSEPWNNRIFFTFKERDIHNPGIMELSYISKNGAFFNYFPGSNFLSSKSKSFKSVKFFLYL